MEPTHSSSSTSLFSSESTRDTYLSLLLRPKEYHLPELVQYIYHVMYRPHRVLSMPSVVMNTAAFLLEQNPFVPYMTRDIMKRVSGVCGQWGIGGRGARDSSGVHHLEVSSIVVYRRGGVHPLGIKEHHSVKCALFRIKSPLVFQLHMSNVPTPNLPNLEDLGVTPTVLEDKAIAFLRMYRDFLDFSRPIEETHPSHSKQD